HIKTQKIVTIQRVWRGRMARKRYFRLYDMFVRREYIAKELCTTEQSYVDSFRALQRVYIIPLNDPSHGRILSEEDLDILFYNSTRILLLQERVLQRLKERVEHWYPHQSIGDIFLDLGEEIKLLYSQYVANHHRANATLLSLELKDKKFCAFEEDAMQNPQCKGHRLSDFLIMPVQRIPRYEMLLSVSFYDDTSTEREQNMVKYTIDDVRDKNRLQKALEMMREINALSNELTKKVTIRSRMNIVQQKSESPLMNYRPGRELKKEGFLIYVGKRGEKNLYAFLYSDGLHLSKKTDRKNVSFRYDIKETLCLINATLEDDPVLFVKRRPQEKMKKREPRDSFLTPSSPESLGRYSDLDVPEPCITLTSSPSTPPMDRNRLKTEDREGPTYPFALTISVGEEGRRTFVFRVPSEAEKNEWLHAIARRAINADTMYFDVLLWSLYVSLDHWYPKRLLRGSVSTITKHKAACRKRIEC
ncbi:hypothetical protein PROFUN_11072, partial [Planoprotostelium fungivorum]